MTRVLFVNSNHNDYLADSVFHGVRTLLGADAVDFPKAEYLYTTAPEAVRGRLYGQGFTLYGRLEDIPVERDHVLSRALDGEFDLVIFGCIWGTFGTWTEWGPQLQAAGVRMAVLDGADNPSPYPFAGRWWRRPAWWFLPRAHPRAAYFKREITAATLWRSSYMVFPPLARRLHIRTISFSIPEEVVLASPPAKEKQFPEHVVDEELASRLARDTSYAFDEEASYYDDLRRSQFGVTARRAGWDALRHYEIAANGAVPCFRGLARKPRRCAPHGLNDSNCIAYESADELLERVERLEGSRYAELQAGALAWAAENTTVARARQLLTELLR